MTLKEFVAQEGSVEKASQKIGVTVQSVSRWLKGKKPKSYLALRRLRDLGVQLDG